MTEQPPAETPTLVKDSYESGPPANLWVRFRYWLIGKVVGDYGVVMNVKIDQYQQQPVFTALKKNTLVKDCTLVTEPWICIDGEESDGATHEASVSLTSDEFLSEPRSVRWDSLSDEEKKKWWSYEEKSE